MASKKIHCGTSSFLLTKNEAKQASKGTENTSNTFANDGSFFEMYKKRMEQMEKAKTLTKDSAPSSSDGGKDEKNSSNSTDKTTDGQGDSRTVKTSLISQGKRKLMVGRMGGASKQFQAKKKKQEKQAEQEKTKDDKGENTAWNAYMEEVKKYREGSCTEEVDRVRPLVK